MESKHFVTTYKPPLTATYTHAIDVADEISLLWTQAQENFVVIGRILNRAKESLKHGEWGKLVRLHLPFEYGVANKLRKIATAIDSQQFRIEEFPADYTAAHLLVTAQPELIKIARDRCFIHNRLTRKEIIQFRKEFTTNQAHVDADGPIIDAEIEIVQCIENNTNRLDDLRKRLNQIAEKRAELDREESDILHEISILVGQRNGNDSNEAAPSAPLILIEKKGLS